MLNRILQDMVVYGTVCPMFGELFTAAIHGWNFVTMAMPPGTDVDAIETRYKELGFTCSRGFDLEKGSTTLKVEFAKSLEELNRDQAGTP